MALSSVKIPTTQELSDQNLSRIESRLNQATPMSQRAYNRVLSVVMAMASTTAYKALARAIMDVFALSASRTGLILIGNEIGITPNPDVATVLTVEFDAED